MFIVVMFYDRPAARDEAVPANGGCRAAGGAGVEAAAFRGEPDVSELRISLRRLRRRPGYIAAAVA
jgi:hypothetical protein